MLLSAVECYAAALLFDRIHPVSFVNPLARIYHRHRGMPTLNVKEAFIFA